MFEFVQKEHQPNTIYCKMMEAKYFATCNKDCTVSFQRYHSLC